MNCGAAAAIRVVVVTLAVLLVSEAAWTVAYWYGHIGVWVYAVGATGSGGLIGQRVTRSALATLDRP